MTTKNLYALGIVSMILCGSMQAMDHLGLELWKIDPSQLTPQQLSTIEASLEDPAFNTQCQKGYRYWGFLGLLQDCHQDCHEDVAEILDIMPEDVKQFFQKATVDQIKNELERLVGLKFMSVFQVIQAWAYIAYLQVQGIDPKDSVGQLKTKLASAALPAGCPAMRADQKKGTDSPQDHIPRVPEHGHGIQGSIADEHGNRGVAPVPCEGRQEPTLSSVTKGDISHGMPEDFADQPSGVDAVGLMLQRHYKDIQEDTIDKNDLLATVAFMQRCLALHRAQSQASFCALPIQQVPAPVSEQSVKPIVACHRQASPFDKLTEPSLHIAVRFPDLGIEGFVIPALQQARSAQEKTAMCGYYALYHARQLLYDSDDRLFKRESFAALFEMLLNVIRDTHAGRNLQAPLTSQDIKVLINRFMQDLPIVVIESEALEALKAEPDMDLVTIFDRDQRAANIMQGFIQGKLDRISIVAGVGRRDGHWIAIHARKDPRGTVLIWVADSLHSVRFYDNRELLKMRIAPFYNILTNRPEPVELGSQSAPFDADDHKQVHSRGVIIEPVEDDKKSTESLEGDEARPMEQPTEIDRVQQELKSTKSELEGAIQAIERLRKENEQLRNPPADKEVPEEGALKAQQSQLKAQIEGMRAQVATADRVRAIALQAAREQTDKIADVEKAYQNALRAQKNEYESQVKGLNARIKQLESAAATSAPKATTQLTGSTIDPTKVAQMQQLMEEKVMESLMLRVALDKLTSKYKTTDAEVDAIFKSITQEDLESATKEIADRAAGTSGTDAAVDPDEDEE